MSYDDVMSKVRKICVVTGTRAEYGILSGLMKELQANADVCLQIIATNMHLSPEFGLTYQEIEADGFIIDKKIEMLLSSDTQVGTVKSMGVALIGLADALSELKPDMILILGDRYEMLTVASAATIMGIPIAHLHGGEITEGAYDDAIRHAITKLSYLHFTSTEEYRKRVIQMGEAPDRVFCVGALGVDNILREKILSRAELSESLDIDLSGDFVVVTYHPVTKEPGKAESQVEALLSALEDIVSDYKIIFTLPNSDSDGRIITSMIKKWVEAHKDRAYAFQSLGRKRYYSALNYCTAVIGNSSSGILEAPSFKVPTLNIGNRQKGRTQGNTVINCTPDKESIKDGLRKVLSAEFIDSTKKQGYNPYFRENTLQEITGILINTPLSVIESKKFYDIKFDI